MTPDAAIALRRRWTQISWYTMDHPEATILATDDWLAYVTAMAHAIPDEDDLTFPTEEEVRWAWPNGVIIMFDRPITVEHVISSKTDLGGSFHRIPPTLETQEVQSVIVYPKQPVPTEIYTASPDLDKWGMEINTPTYKGTIAMYPMKSIGTDPTDVIEGYMPFNSKIVRLLDHINFYTRFELALVTALGHRLSAITEPVYANRQERRRIERQLPDLRVIDLRSPSSKPESRGGSIEWTHRWMVRGHWRLQPCGPGRAERRPTWIDSHVKGPADKPLDIRPTIWKTTTP